jgi:protein required for attachment to host cells
MLTQPKGYSLPNSPTCIVACSSAIARCWISESRHSDWELMADFAHEEAAQREQDFQSDRPGRSFDSLGRGRHAMSLEHSAKEQSNIRFAETVADFLNHSVAAGQFRHLVIFADPKFLGLLRGRLSHAAAAAVVLETPRNLANVDVREIRAYFD